jgi:hypothetical protein
VDRSADQVDIAVEDRARQEVPTADGLAQLGGAQFEQGQEMSGADERVRQHVPAGERQRRHEPAVHHRDDESAEGKRPLGEQSELLELGVIRDAAEP